MILFPDLKEKDMRYRFTDYELSILRKHFKPRPVETEEEERFLKPYESIGWIHEKTRITKKPGEQPEAITEYVLANEGRGFVRRDIIMRSKILGPLYRLINIPA